MNKNNSYVYATSTSLTKGGFKCLDSSKFKLGKYDDSISKGCVLESDLEYPEELLQLQNYNPFALEKLEMLKKCCLIKNLKLLRIIILEFATLFKARIQNKKVNRVL